MVIEAVRKPDLNQNSVRSPELRCRKTGLQNYELISPPSVKLINDFSSSQFVYNLLILKKDPTFSIEPFPTPSSSASGRTQLSDC
jgi:hypothetical protein